MNPYWCTNSKLRRQQKLYFSVKSKRVTPRVKHIDIPVYFIKEIFDNIPFVSKYKKSSIMPSDICTKPYSGPIMSWGTK